MSEPLVIQSHVGPYTVTFDDEAFARLNDDVPAGTHFVIDDTVAQLYERDLGRVLSSKSVLRIEASEAAKSLDRFPAYVESLVSSGIRRQHRLVAIGGGVIQDITCFLAATLLRGVPWEFFPTTLLAQADSCIGSKSSINVASAKNILGTFTPPVQVTISTRVLRTLSEVDRRSGIGEMLKVHAIDGPVAFDQLATDYHALLSDDAVLHRYIRRSLDIKKRLIELDEFDCGPRNIMNYGHTFGHAIEAATRYAVPHGIAVTIGMDMANFVAVELGRSHRSHFDRMHPTLSTNAAGYAGSAIPIEAFTAAIAKDKKNTDRELRLILPDMDAHIGVCQYPASDLFWAACTKYFDEYL